MRSIRDAAGAFLREAALGTWLGFWLLGVGGRLAMRVTAMGLGEEPALSGGGTLTVVAAGAAAGAALHPASRAAANRLGGGRARVRLALFALLLTLVTARGLQGSPGTHLLFWLLVAAYGAALDRVLARRAAGSTDSVTPTTLRTRDDDA